MNISDINSMVSFRASTDTTQYSAANRLISTNRWYQKIVTMILGAQDEWDWDDSNQSDYPIATTNLIAGQQDYTFPGSLKILKIKRAEISLDGVTWKRLQPFDINQFALATDTTSIRNNFSTDQPCYDMEYNAIKLYPTPTANVTTGLKIWFLREPVEFTTAEVTAGTKEPGFDEAFHSMIPLGMIYDWCSAKGGSSPILANLKVDVEKELLDYEVRLRQYYGKKQRDREWQLQSVYPSNYGA
jgi:hypothetical protein